MTSAPSLQLNTSKACLDRPTVAILPEREGKIINNRLEEFECYPFENDAAYDAYVESVSPSRELVCPITQEVLKDPVVAEDGHTYERKSLMKWFSMGRTRSPVTNSLMTGKRVFANIAVQGMALSHRERLGTELLNRCERMYVIGGHCLDQGSRISALLDGGADLTLRSDTSNGNTALHFVIMSRQLQIAKNFLHHDASVTIVNNDGVSSAGAIEELIRSLDSSLIADWTLFLEDVRKIETYEKERTDARDHARNRANEEHRRRQRTLAANARNSRGNNTIMNDPNIQGLGQLQDGWGYFPSLVALQFQSSIPPPSASTERSEMMEKQRLNTILRILVFCTVFLWLLC